LTIKLTAKEIESFCANTVKSFEAQIQTIDPTETERANLKLCGLQQQLQGLKWDTKKIARYFTDNALDGGADCPLKLIEKTMIDLKEMLDNVEYDISKNDPSSDDYFFHRATNF